MSALDRVSVVAAPRRFPQLVVSDADLVYERVARESWAFGTLQLREYRRLEVSVAPHPDSHHVASLGPFCFVFAPVNGVQLKDRGD